MNLDREFLCAVVESVSGPTFVCGCLEDGGRWGDSHWIRVRTPDGPTLPEPIPAHERLPATLLVGRHEAARGALASFYRSHPDKLQKRRNLITRSV